MHSHTKLMRRLIMDYNMRGIVTVSQLYSVDHVMMCIVIYVTT